MKKQNARFIMAGLVIDHGDPWWLSPNVWVTPISNPSEPSPGELSPIVGQKYYAAANVRNTTNADIYNATVYFYWANPALGIITSVNAVPIGTSSVTVYGGQSNNTLELKVWQPSFVNNGHECIIAAVVEGQGPPPSVLDGDADPTVAQRNLGVVVASKMGLFHYPFQVCNPRRIEQTFSIRARQAPSRDAAPFSKKLSIQAGQLRGHGFLRATCPDPSQYATAPRVIEDVRVAPFTCTGFTLVGTLEAGSALLHVTQHARDRIVGGLSVLVVSDMEQDHERNA
ncbi:hypothetical protein [Burkholderia sp. lig30]|uniref:hypothetical protein n=1 Tax=Burkholderia sp. lig30 TaxID=1192124 RepID=UPI0005728D90|nr:hypothetical protein [Burkholderia sp. lig30]